MAQDAFFNYSYANKNRVGTGAFTTTPPSAYSLIDDLSFNDMSSQTDVPAGNGMFCLLISGLLYANIKNKE